MNTEENIIKCLNCGKEFTGNFCPQCGQKAKTKRLKLKEILSDFANSIIGGDNKFINTVFGMCRRPGHMVREYLQGHRNQYYNPLQMLIWIISIYAVLSYILGSDPFEFSAVSKDITIPEDGSPWKIFMAYIKKTTNFITSNKLYYTLICTTMAIAPYRYAFRKFKISRPDGNELPLNHTEQFYALIYQSCMEMMFATLLLPFCLIKGSEEVLKTINNYADITLSVILFKQIYCIGWWKSIKRNLVAFILLILYISIIVIAIFALVIIIFILIYGVDKLDIG